MPNAHTSPVDSPIFKPTTARGAPGVPQQAETDQDCLKSVLGWERTRDQNQSSSGKGREWLLGDSHLCLPQTESFLKTPGFGVSPTWVCP